MNLLTQLYSISLAYYRRYGSPDPEWMATIMIGVTVAIRLDLIAMVITDGNWLKTGDHAIGFLVASTTFVAFLYFFVRPKVIAYLELEGSELPYDKTWMVWAYLVELFVEMVIAWRLLAF